ncbi:hypothetical protein QF021_002651 [Acidovorax delafieldii]|nr:hypothetical protein [Acidovorax delafieldii]
MRVTFFCFAKRKSPKKRRPPVCDPFAGRRGKPASGRLRGAPWNSLCAAARRSGSHGESVHEAWALRRPCHPATAPPQAQPAGVDSRTSKQPNSRTSIRAIAALGPVCAARGACAREMGPSAAMARGDVWFPTPLWMRRGAQRAGWRVCRRTHALRELTRCGCLSGARQRAASSAAHPAREHRRLPRRAAAGTQTAGSPFFWVLFFGEAKKSTSHAGRLPASALNPSMRPNQRTQLNATKSIATSAYPTSASSQNHPKKSHHPPIPPHRQPRRHQRQHRPQ